MTIDTSKERYERQKLRLFWLAETLSKYVHSKDKQYGSSWKKRGGTQAFAVLSRKWDRLEHALSPSEEGGGCSPDRAPYDIFQLLQEDKRQENAVDDIVDLIGYLFVLLEEGIERKYIKKILGDWDPVVEEEFEGKTLRVDAGELQGSSDGFPSDGGRIEHPRPFGYDGDDEEDEEDDGETDSPAPVVKRGPRRKPKITTRSTS